MNFIEVAEGNWAIHNFRMKENDLIIKSRERNLGGFSVHRSIPSHLRRHVGPFVFLDHLGPMIIDSHSALDVRAHPHIGLSTVTYLFDGRCRHRDNLGNDIIINPGDLNWMTAGSGVVHSERTPLEDRDPEDKNKLHGIQIWVGLPLKEEERDADFIHYSGEELPSFCFKGLEGKLLIGEYEGILSPVKTYSDMIFMELRGMENGHETIYFNKEEIGVFLVSGECTVNGTKLLENDLIVVGDPEQIDVKYSKGAHIIIIGGEPFPEPRHIWWNFISSRKERILEAANDWEEGLFPKIPGETEFIPLPEKIDIT